jgi:hypothetical protein
MSLTTASNLRLYWAIQYCVGRGLGWGRHGDERLIFESKNILEKYLYLFAITVLRKCVVSTTKNILFKARAQIP